jgi:hypothetical protein
MVEVVIGLIQFLGVLIPVLFGALRFLHTTDEDGDFRRGTIRYTREIEEDGVILYEENYIPYSSIIWVIAFSVLTFALLLLLVNLLIYSISGNVIELLTIFSLVFQILGTLVFGLGLVLKTPRSRLRSV